MSCYQSTMFIFHTSLVQLVARRRKRLISISWRSIRPEQFAFAGVVGKPGANSSSFDLARKNSILRTRSLVCTDIAHSGQFSMSYAFALAICVTKFRRTLGAQIGQPTISKD